MDLPTDRGDSKRACAFVIKSRASHERARNRGAEPEHEFTIALSTFPNQETARKIARELVEAGLVACANILPSIASVYFWKGKVEEEAEVLAIFKLTTNSFERFQKRLRGLHPYDVPEIIRLNIADGSPDYLQWISESCKRA
jgi:periplasmic divalent cation tolerance protein